MERTLKLIALCTMLVCSLVLFSFPAAEWEISSRENGSG